MSSSRKREGILAGLLKVSDELVELPSELRPFGELVLGGGLVELEL